MANNALQVQIKLQFIKKEQKEYQGNSLFYYHCNFFDADGLASPIKLKVSKDVYEQKIGKGEFLEVFADVVSDYLRVSALDIKKTKV
jgi:hypothetical protein